MYVQLVLEDPNLRDVMLPQVSQVGKRPTQAGKPPVLGEVGWHRPSLPRLVSGILFSVDSDPGGRGGWIGEFPCCLG